MAAAPVLDHDQLLRQCAHEQVAGEAIVIANSCRRRALTRSLWRTIDTACACFDGALELRTLIHGISPREAGGAETASAQVGRINTGHSALRTSDTSRSRSPRSALSRT